jgi:hypothetical protein
MSNTLDEVDLISAKSGARLRRLSVIAENAIDHYPKWAFTSVSMLYFLVFIVLSYFKLLWLDELITLHIARLGTVSSIWHALALGADPNPPITVLLVRASESIFGAHELAYRLPAAIGYWVGLLSLFLYLRRYLRSIWALCGTVLSMTMAAFDYSYESRSYGVIYGLAMLGFLCWSYSEESNRTAKARLLAAVGMTFALTVGISTNYFAVLALLPIAAGEVVRTIEQWRGIALLPRSQPGFCKISAGIATRFSSFLSSLVPLTSVVLHPWRMAHLASIPRVANLQSNIFCPPLSYRFRSGRRIICRPQPIYCQTEHRDDRFDRENYCRNSRDCDSQMAFSAPPMPCSDRGPHDLFA